MSNLKRHAERAAGLRLRLLRGFELRTPSGAVTVPRAVQRLLAFVALHDCAVQRTYVAGSLWTDKTDQRAAANLRSALWRLSRPGLEVLAATPTHLALNHNVTVDVKESSIAAQSLLRGDADAVAPDIEETLRADLLPDWYEDWVLLERERYRQLRLHALEQLCACYSSAEQFGLAIDAGLAAVNAEPLRESAHRQLIQAHLAEGNRDEAARQYEICCHLLEEQLGEFPSRDLAMLAARAGVDDRGRRNLKPHAVTARD